MKVTVIPTIIAFPWGAPGHCMGALVEELLEAGHEVQWFVAPIDLGHPEVARLRARGALVESLPAEPRKYGLAAALRHKIDRVTGTKSLPAMVRSFGPDFIYLNQGGMWCGAFGQFAEVLRDYPGCYAPICHLAQPAPPLNPADLQRARDFASNAKRIFVNSVYMQELAEVQLARKLPRVQGYDLPHRLDFQAPLAWPRNEEARLMCVGRLDTLHKGLDIGLQALALLKASGHRFRLTICGEGPDREYLGDVAGYLGLSQEVFFAGQVGSIEKVWAEHEVLFLPSRYEGCSVALTEAMGFGRPVIATAVGGAPEWIEDGVTGFLAPAPQQALIHQALERALAARVRWPEMGQAAHAKFKGKMPERPARVFLEALRPEGAE